MSDTSVGTLEIGLEMNLAELYKQVREAKSQFDSLKGDVVGSMSEADKAVAKAGLSYRQLERSAQRLRDQIDPLAPAERNYAQALAIADAQRAKNIISEEEYGRALELARAKRDAATAAEQRFSRQVAQLKASVEPAWAAIQRYKEQVDLLRQAQAAGAITHDQYLAEIRKAKAEYKQAGQGITAVSGSMRAGMQQLSFQANDMATMWSMNAKPMQIFASQAGQVIQALQLMSTSSKGLLGFLGGPWGMVLTTAAVVLTPFVAKLFESSEAADQAKLSARDQASALDFQRQSTSELTKAINDQLVAQRKSIQLGYEAAKATRAQAQENLRNAITKREETKSLLDNYKAALMSTGTAAGDPAVAVGTKAGAALGMQWKQSDLDEQDRNIEHLKELQRLAEVPLVMREVKASLDAAEASTLGYEKAQAKLNEQWRLGLIDRDTYASQSRTLEAKKDAEIKKIRAQESAQKKLNQANREFGREIDEQAARAIAARNKFVVNSGYRSFERQKQLYDQWVAQGRPADNATARPGSSAHNRGNALDIAFGPGVSAASIRKAYEDEGVRLTKLLRERGHFHIEWSTSGADKIKREADELQKYGDRTAESIQRISERFDEQPKLIDQVAQASRNLDGIIADLAARQPPGFEKMIADARRAKTVVEDAINRPFREYLQDQQRSADLQKLVLAGREDEASALQVIYRLQDQVGDVTAAQRAEVLKTIQAERELNELLTQRQQIISAYSASISSVRGDLESLLGGGLSGKDFLKNLRANYQQMQGKLLTEQLFGAPLRALEEQIRKSTVIDAGVADLKNGMSDAGQEAHNLAAAFANARGLIDGAPATGGMSDASWQDVLNTFDRVMAPLGENGEIVVTGVKTAAATAKTAAATAHAATGLAGIRPSEYADMLSNVMVAPLVEQLQKLGIDLDATLSGAMSGYMQGGIPGAVVGGLKGFMKDAGGKLFGDAAATGIINGLDKMMGGIQTGTMAAGLMKALGVKTSTTGAQIGGALGSLVGPIGSIVGSIAGGIIGGLFKSAKWGRATISDVSGDFTVAGNKGKFKDAASEAGNSIVDALTSIADQLGGVAGSFEQITVGVRDGKWRVNVGGTSLKTGKRAVDFGKDGAEEAVAYAIQQAIKLGAISGLRQSTLNLLQAGNDFQAQLQKAITFEGVFDALKAETDPLGFALDQLGVKFAQLRKIFVEAGATAEEMAQLDQLQAIEEQKVREAAAAEANAKRARQLELEAQLLALQGKASASLAKAREAELLQMEAGLQAIQKQIYAEEDAAARRQLQIQLLEAQGNVAAARAAQRAEELRTVVDENKAIQQRIWLTQDLSEAYQRESQALQTTVDKMKQMGDGLRDFRASLFTVDDSTLGYNQALAKLMQVGGLAGAGDETAIGNLSEVGREFLSAAKNNAGTLADYQRAVGLVTRYADQAIAWTDSEGSLAQQQLDEMKTQVGALISIDENVVSVHDALEALTSFLGGGVPDAPATTSSSSSSSTAVHNRKVEDLLQKLQDQMAKLMQPLANLDLRFGRWDRGTYMASTDDEAVTP